MNEVEGIPPSELKIKSGLEPPDIKIQSEPSAIIYEDLIPENLEKHPTSDCNRCKKKFAQLGPKPFKMCEHCRIAQRQRTKRWQKKTKEKEGVCKRCETELPMDNPNNYVLCGNCRKISNKNKSERYLKGKCIHCGNPNMGDSGYKVCQTCREKDRIRRLNLSNEGLCNRCSRELPKDESTHRVCLKCRIKKRMNSGHAHYNPKSIRSTDSNKLPSQLTTQGDTTLYTEIGDLYTAKCDSDARNNQTAGKRQFDADQLSSKRQKMEPTHPLGTSSQMKEQTKSCEVDISVYEKELTEKLLSETFMQQDHSELNQQLKQLTRYTSHSQQDNGTLAEDDSKFDDQSVLVDLNGLGDLDIDYHMDVSDTIGGHHNTNDCNVNADHDEEEDNDDNGDEEDDDDYDENEKMLRHVREVQAGLLSNTSEPSDAEIAAAVEAVAVAAAVARGNKQKDS